MLANIHIVVKVLIYVLQILVVRVFQYFGKYCTFLKSIAILILLEVPWGVGVQVRGYIYLKV